jgi:hypothetical protein
MDILRNLFGNLTSGLIRLAVTAGILALTYLFIVKPVLKTTDEAFKSTNETIQRSFGGEAGLGEIGETIRSVNREVQRQIRRSFRATKKQGGADPQRLVHCIQRAHGDVHRIERCTRRF